jgi:hypothetical protein
MKDDKKINPLVGAKEDKQAILHACHELQRGRPNRQVLATGIFLSLIELADLLPLS